MANYIGFARSNYFRVKDRDEFEVWCAHRGLTCQSRRLKLDCPEIFWMIYCDAEGGWPQYDIITDDAIYIVDELSKHLKEGEVAILQEVGFEKLLYLMGRSVAVNSSGEVETTDISDIYRLAESLGSNITRAEY